MLRKVESKIDVSENLHVISEAEKNNNLNLTLHYGAFM